MMKLKKIVGLVAGVMLMFSLAGCGGLSNENKSATGGQNIAISIGHGGAESTAQQIGCLALKKSLEEQSKGRITVNIYPNNSMGNDDELVQMVQNGNLQMCLANSIIVNYVKDATIYDLFYNFDNIEEVKNKYMKDQNFLKTMREKYKNAGIYLGGFSVHGFRQSTANKPLKTPDDLKGLTFRVMQNDYHIEAWKDMGATPTPFSFSELYTALQQKTVDAQENPIELIYSQKFYEQQKYITLTNHLQQTQQWLVSQKFYDSLSDDDKKILDKAIQDACAAATNYALDNEAKWSSEIEKYGCTFVKLTPEEQKAFKDRVKPEWDKIKAQVSPDVWDAYTKKM
ncbi:MULTISPECIES: TRAP transporter substrate-binding protein [Acidaminococcus]|uniref:TRAP transporter substrate-binding protein n=1 Tax=Acidaminococcus TaxID=904 RepID=UPI0003AE0072|nr:TRAP transporter substrate-binding protein [Acidaminococcus sp. BV3L6]ERL16156.1 TRAP transporter solute receptor, DctP family [Acidaminococcus sp. BV3L6]